MYLFIYTKSDLNIPTLIMEAIIVDMIDTCQQNSGINIVIVGDKYLENVKKLSESQSTISFVTTSEASVLIKKGGNASVIHFGANTKWASKYPVYFFPLVLPSEMNELSFLSRIILKRHYNKWLENATKILCANDWAFSNLQNGYPNLSNKIQLVNLPVTTPIQFAWSALSEAKEQLTNGNNYFLIFAPLARLVAILKEFSIFKKWQQTTMNLVVVLENQQQVEKAMVLIQGYKFKQDIVLHTIDEVCLDWLAASYVVLWEGIDASKTTWIENAIQYDIPLLFDKQIKLPATWLKVGEVFSFSEHQALSNHFKLYYKDEIYRQASASLGKQWLVSLGEEQGKQELFNKIVLSHII